MFNLYSSNSNGRNDKMKSIIIYTHDGKFHNDETLAVAVLMETHHVLDVVRSRRKEYPKGYAMVSVDVGGVYDPNHNCFDHHQSDCFEVFNETSEVPMASAGMVWKKYGPEFLDNDQSAINYVYERLFKAVDAQDNGITIDSKPIFQTEYLNPSWDSSSNGDDEFMKTVDIYRTLLRAVIERAKAEARSTLTLNVAMCSDLSQEDILVLPQYIPWMSQIGNDHTFKLCIFPDKFSKEWRISTIPVDVDVKFGPNRIDIPAEWVENPPSLTTFVHKGRFLMGVDKNATIEEVLMIAKAIINQ